MEEEGPFGEYDILGVSASICRSRPQRSVPKKLTHAYYKELFLFLLSVTTQNSEKVARYSFSGHKDERVIDSRALK